MNLRWLTALLTVLALTGPSVAALACDWTCGVQHHDAAASATSMACHEHGAQQSDAPALSAEHGCHEPVDLATTIVPGASPLAFVPVVASIAHAAADDAGRRAFVSFTALRPPAPPLRTAPLRI